MKLVRLLFLSIFCAFAFPAYAQLNIGTVDAGPYTPGSTIAATFSIDPATCILQGNTFRLILSDASGNFSPGTEIGTYNSFYSTFVNGTIPIGTPPGTSYKVRILSTNPVLTSNDSAPFEIRAGTAVEAKLTSNAINTTYPETFGLCAGKDNFGYAFTNESTPTATVTAKIANELTGGAPSNVNFNTPIQIFNAGLAHYTVFTKAVMQDGSVATKAYFLVNNQTVTAFSTSGTNVVCLPLSSLEFGVDISADGILKNFPGDTYEVNWGDQTTSSYTLCDIRQNLGKIRHLYTQSSCGNVFSGSAGTEYNVFSITISVQNPFCGRVGSTISSTAKVVVKPTNAFTGNTLACTNVNTTFTNISILGEDPNTNSPGCQSNNVVYNWFVDGVPVAVNKPISYVLVHKFLTHGNHVVRLESISSGTCDADPFEMIVCVQDPPKPIFIFSNTNVCAPSILKPTNTSIIDAICNTNNTYSWSVSPNTGVTFQNGNANSAEPEFKFSTPGVYDVTLSISTASCGTVSSTPQRIIVNDAPQITMSPDIELCNRTTYSFDPATTGPTKTSFSGTFLDLSDTYTWTVTGGTYTFVSSTANTKYPSIQFLDFGTYTVSVTHKNACGTITKSQKLTFNTAPIVNAGPDQAICYNEPSFTLAGSITGNTISQKWSGGNGIFSPNNTILNATYTPTLAEKNAGTVTLTLTVTTSLPFPCNSVSEQVVLTIKPRIIINSAASKNICTGTAVAYSPASNKAGATFSWTATSTTATGFNPTGNGTTINDVLTSNSATANGTVIYTITPSFDDCLGDPFTFTATVTPRPALIATPANPIICSLQGTGISLSSTLTGTKYTWTSTAAPGITGNTNQTTQITTTLINNVLTNSLITPATVDYTITPYSALGCAGTPMTVTITVAPAPTLPNAGADESICNSGSYVLKGNDPIVGTGKWTEFSNIGGVTFVDDTKYNTTVNGLVAGNTYIFRWTITGAATCTPKTDNVSITVNPPSVGGITAGDNTVCANSNSGQITLTGKVGNVLRWERSTDGGNTWAPITNNTTTLNYTNLTTTTQYRAIVQNGVCSTDNSTVTTITVNPAVVASVAGSPQELCNQTSTILAGNSPLTNTGLWTQTGGPTGATFVDATLYNTQVNNLIPGNIYTFTWTISGLAPCPPSTSSVSIKINAPSDGGITAGSTTVCSGNSSGTITLSGQIGTVTGWERSTDGGTTWSPINITINSIPYVNLTTTTQYRAIVKNGNCAPANSTIAIVTVNPGSITAMAGGDQELCDQTSTTLAGNSPQAQTGLWTQTGGPAGATFVDANLYNTQVNGLIPGNTYIFTWTISGLAPCPPSSDDVIIKINALSSGGTTAGSTSVCSGSSNGSITLSGQVGNILRWESSTDGGTTWSPINITTNSIPYINLTTTTQYKAIVKNGNCAPANSTIAIVTVNPGSITAMAGGDQELCDQTSATLAGNSPQTQTGLWTQTGGPAGATFVDANLYNTQVNGLILGNTYIFTWTISGLAPCPPSSDNVIIKINELSNGGVTAGSTPVCSGSSNGTITLSGQVGNILRWESSTDGGTTWQTINNITNSTPYVNLTITTQYKAVVQNGNCAPTNSTIATITVNPGSITATAGTNKELCDQTSYTLEGNSPQTQTGLWTQTAGPTGATFADATLYNTQVNGLIPGNTYIFTWTISGLAPCPPTSSSVEIKINELSNGGTTAGSTAVCAGNSNGSITLSGQVGIIQSWESSVDGGTTWAPINNTTTNVTYSNLTTTTQYRAIVKNGNCAAATSTIATITINQAVVQATAGADKILCNEASIILDGNSPVANIGLWTLTSGQSGVTFTDATLFNTQVSGLVGGEIYTFCWTISGLAPCPPTSDEVTIINLAPLTNNNITTPFLSACSGQVITLTGSTPTGGNGTYAYVWESSADGGITWATINGQTRPNLNVTVVSSLAYRRTVNSGNCTSVSSVLNVVALPPIANNAITGDQTICLTNTPTPITGSQPTGGDGINYTYGWEQSIDNGTIWTAIIGANDQNYAPGTITQTTLYRRLVSSAACTGSFQNVSNVIKIIVKPNAKAEFTYTTDLACIPFVIDANNIKAVPYPDRNSIYTWYVDDIEIGTGINFPGYTILTDNTAVEIKLVATSSLGCSQDEMSHTFRTRQNVVASFNPSATTGCGPLTVDFTNTSTTLTSVTFEWRVNNVIVSAAQDFHHSFDPDPFGEDKDYTVTLTVITPCGKSVSAPTKITVYSAPIATGTPDKTRGCSPLTVNFRNTSPGATNTYTYEIDGVIVGDPTTNKNDFPWTFTTDVVKEYTVKVTATNSCGSDFREYVIVVSPNTIRAGLTVDGNKLHGCAPFDVDFINSTVGASQYEYTFGDGKPPEISINNRPEIKRHRFEKPGRYTVKMVATNDCSTATVPEITIIVDPQPITAFVADLTVGCTGLSVKFTNNSKEAIAYVWDFGDGSPTSNEVSPIHVYNAPAGLYDVTLTAINSLGCPTAFTKKNYVTIVGPPKADFIIVPASVISIPDFTFKFTNTSSGDAQTYKWNFGDGTEESTLKDPTHTYRDIGKYSVTLTAYNQQGCSDIWQNDVEILGVPGILFVPNSFIPEGESVPLQQFMAIGTGIKSWKMTVINKWGQVLWETNKLYDGKPVEGWDGTFKGVAQPQGIYFWKIEVELINGTEWKGMSYDQSPPKRTGQIYLIR